MSDRRRAGRLKSADEDTEGSSSLRPPTRPRGTISSTGPLTASHCARVPPDLVRDDDCSTGVVTSASYAVGVETGIHRLQEAAPGALVKVTVAKRTSKSSVGIKFADSSNGKIVVYSISQVSLFQGTALEVGHEIVSINGMPCEGLRADLLNTIIPGIEGDLTIVARRHEASVSTSTDQATVASLSRAHPQTVDHHFVRARAPEAPANRSVGGINVVHPVTEQVEQRSRSPHQQEASLITENEMDGEVIVDEMGSGSTTQAQVASSPHPPSELPGEPVSSPGAFAVHGQTEVQRTLGMLSPLPEDATVDGQIPIAAEVASQGDWEARIQEAVNRAIGQSAVPAETVVPIEERNVAGERVDLSDSMSSFDDPEVPVHEDGDGIGHSTADEPSPPSPNSKKKLWKRPSFLAIVAVLLIAIIVGTIVGILSGDNSGEPPPGCTLCYQDATPTVTSDACTQLAAEADAIPDDTFDACIDVQVRASVDCGCPPVPPPQEACPVCGVDPLPFPDLAVFREGQEPTTCGQLEVYAAIYQGRCDSITDYAFYCGCPGVIPACPLCAGSLSPVPDLVLNGYAPEFIPPENYTCAEAQRQRSLNTDETECTAAEDNVIERLCGCDRPNGELNCTTICPDGTLVPEEFLDAQAFVDDPFSGSLTCSQFQFWAASGEFWQQDCNAANYVGIKRCGCETTRLFCDFCEDGSVPEDLAYVVNSYGRTCLSHAGDAYSVDPLSDFCPAFQSTYAVYCGCDNPIANEGACRICDEDGGDVVPDHDQVVNVGGQPVDCSDLEWTGNWAGADFSCVDVTDFGVDCCS